MVLTLLRVALIWTGCFCFTTPPLEPAPTIKIEILPATTTFADFEIKTSTPLEGGGVETMKASVRGVRPYFHEVAFQNKPRTQTAATCYGKKYYLKKDLWLSWQRIERNVLETAATL